ncbi:TIGR04197 family type VII secretion effector [Lactococcus lactis]|uniref:TIGR04197 family type VII secretion effector n=1 Tax=Lactococcus lactis TaxID=1358 RepID=UPI00240E53E3|nr:TIGR04197 family type VII secretion effector [Lactococcus lactis]WFB96754.1 TIGR04197 family type VII secretion effector [Lactococcus lactis]
MAAGTIKSNTVDAQDAISELTGVQVSNFQTIELGESNVESMKNGAQMANELMGNVSKVVACILAQAIKFPELAHRIEERDIQDAKRWK